MSYAVGEQVFVDIGGYWYAGRVTGERDGKILADVEGPAPSRSAAAAPGNVRRRLPLGELRAGDAAMYCYAGCWYPGHVLRVESDRVLLRDEAATDREVRLAELARDDRPRLEGPLEDVPAFERGDSSASYAAGDAVEILYSNRWHRGAIKSEAGAGRWKVGYAGYGESWDEVVGAERLRPLVSLTDREWKDGDRVKVKVQGRAAPGRVVLVRPDYVEVEYAAGRKRATQNFPYARLTRDRRPEPLAFEVPPPVTPVFDRSALAGLAAGPLASFASWAGLRETARVAVAEELAAALGKGYRARTRLVGDAALAVVAHGPSKVEFVAVPGGAFAMGMDADEAREFVATLAGVHGDEPGAAAWAAPLIAAAGPRHQVQVGAFLCARRPTEAPLEDAAPGWRLISEAEWEYVAREGGARRWLISEPLAWSAIGPRKRDEDKANAWGVVMLTSDGEQVADSWHESYAGAPDDGSAWGREGAVTRGAHLGWQSHLEGASLHVAVRQRGEGVGRMAISLAAR